MQIARPFGIPLRLHWSFWILIVGVLGYTWSLVGVPALLPTSILLVGLVASVVLHELGHALAARRFDIDTHHITLYPFGGVAAIDHIPEDPDQEIVIAFAGPAVNFVLAAVGGWLWLGTSHPLLMALVLMNLSMGVFNLIPAYPMDGGRILRSLFARRMGWLPASRLAVKIGRGFAWSFLAVGVVMQSPSLLIMGIFLHVTLNAEHQRLVSLHWERTTGRPPPWEQSPGSPAHTTALSL